MTVFSLPSLRCPWTGLRAHSTAWTLRRRVVDSASPPPQQPPPPQPPPPPPSSRLAAPPIRIVNPCRVQRWTAEVSTYEATCGGGRAHITTRRSRSSRLRRSIDRRGSMARGSPGRARMTHDSLLTAVAALPMGWATCALHCMGAASSWRRQRIASAVAAAAAAIVAAIATSLPPPRSTTNTHRRLMPSAAMDS